MTLYVSVLKEERGKKKKRNRERKKGELDNKSRVLKMGTSEEP